MIEWNVLRLWMLAGVMALVLLAPACGAWTVDRTPTAPPEVEAEEWIDPDDDPGATVVPETELRLSRSFTGTVEQIAEDAWVIDGQTVAITTGTVIHGTIRMGQAVRVRARFVKGERLTAYQIELLPTVLEPREDRNQTPTPASEGDE
jgi:hypothetical protein